MKALNSREILTAPLLVKISAFALTSIAFFYLGKHWSESDGYQPLPFFSSRPYQPSISISPNANKQFDISSLISNQSDTPQSSDSTLLPPPPPDRFGIVDENGTMTNNFDVGSVGSDPIENLDDGNSTAEIEGGSSEGSRVRLARFQLCNESMSEYIPCLDNVEAIRKLKSTEKGEKYERHCPEEGKGLDCLVPPPKRYQMPIPWPQSRDEVWYSNVPHPRLVEDKGGQNWISIDKDKFKFPGGGTQFIHGADQYLDQMSEMVPDITFGHHTRVVLDVGCGVASFGAFLVLRNVTVLSVAPKDVHENQIQFALERGVPAMVAAFATRRLLYPSQAFDLIHCSRCRINWTRDDGILLLEVNRILRAGGYFAWAAQPVYKHEESQIEAWKVMENLTARICWKLVKKEGYIAIWQKPLNNSCYLSRDSGSQPPLCDADDDPDRVWYVDLKPCITRIPEKGYRANVTTWPARLHHPPDRLQTVEMDAYMAKKELFKAESKFWNDIIASFARAYHWRELQLRNVMDMRAVFGGFAAALIDYHFDAWVMNVVPTSGPNTLPVIYDRGLIGVTHDWCEPFDTYPRTYDLLHASGLFSIERKRCNITSILLEMDRILRPGGHAYIRDSISVIREVKEITTAMGWRTSMHDTSEGPYASRRVLRCDKELLHA
ncbi:probable methyltransferase PMT11 [Magnolia sinica]|uniref:probable methyltransferase PMT11 n=1 Tax=Magnolia sinica TaxID=86752 RepID=UPI00265A6C9A|nr:probable methyltransferase PMT11 [Magnolia sinica]